MSEPKPASDEPRGYIAEMKRQHETWIERYVEAQRRHVLAILNARYPPIPSHSPSGMGGARG